MSDKTKTEIRMYAWYMVTEPFRLFRRFLHRSGKAINRDTATNTVALFTLVLLIKNLYFTGKVDDLAFWCGFFILIVMHFKNVWDKKKFIHVYREIKYREIKYKD